MLLVARKNLFSERTRLAISVGGVALSVFLIGILLSLYRGWNEKVGEYVERVPADLWVASEGATDFIQAGSSLPDGVGTLLNFVPEVDKVSALDVRPVEVSKGGTRETLDVQLVGYDPRADLGGPLEMVEGKSPPGPGEVVIDQAMSDRFDVNIGDRLVRGTDALTVVGKSAGGDFVFTQVAFVTLDTAADFLELEPPSQRTFFLLTLKDPTEKEWANDPAVKKWEEFMKKYYPEGSLIDSANMYAYTVASTLHQVLKQAGDNLTRENIMKQAADLKGFAVDTLIPGIKMNTSAGDFAPIESVQLMKFNGTQWERFGEVIGK